MVAASEPALFTALGQALTKTKVNQRTAWAVILAIPLVLIFHLLYSFLFQLIIDIYASYDPSFGWGIGAIIFVSSANVLAVLSAVSVTIRLFRNANCKMLFYCVSIFIIFSVIITILSELNENDSSAIIIIINILIGVFSIWACKLAMQFSNEDV